MLRTRRSLEPLDLARPLALGLGALVVTGSAAAWGRSGFVAALVGVALSLVNVLALERLALAAARQALSASAGRASTVLQVSLGAKTVGLLLAVEILAGRLGLLLTPFSLGLLVTVLALLLAGLAAAFANRPEIPSET